jgi:hypothetical protein
VKRQAPVIEVTLIGTTSPPRSKEGTRPGRVSCVRNTETPTEFSLVRGAGRPTVRDVESSGGNRMSIKRMPVGESRQETGTKQWLLLQAVSFPDNWLDTEPGARTPKGVLAWTGEPVNRRRPDLSKPKGKLDT